MEASSSGGLFQAASVHIHVCKHLGDLSMLAGAAEILKVGLSESSADAVHIFTPPINFMRKRGE